MGPLVTADHRKRVVGYTERGVAEGAKPLCDGRKYKSESGGFFLGPTIFDHVKPDMTIAKEEIFGPVLSVIRVKTLDEGDQSDESFSLRQRHIHRHQQRQISARVLLGD